MYRLSATPEIAGLVSEGGTALSEQKERKKVAKNHTAENEHTGLEDPPREVLFPNEPSEIGDEYLDAAVIAVMRRRKLARTKGKR